MMRRVVVIGALAWAAMLVLLGAFVEAAAGVVRVQQVAYQGEAVTLPSGGDPTRKLASIKWSVFFNETWIATFHGGKINTERFFLFRGRLALNASSGDLTIRNVSREDAGDYSVELVDTEKRSVERVLTLVVKRPLQKPSVQTLFSVQSDGGCWVGLRCSSPDLAVNLSWKLEPPLRTAYDMPDPDGGAGVLLKLVALGDGTRFTCTSSRDPENVSDSIRVECVTASEWRSRGRDSLFVLAGIVSGGVLMTVLLKHLQGKEEEREEGSGAKEENG
ncbi:CD48 antigen-like [Phycodurus eques]|uniref:CD48 antigen-like n=1 Tax=Phycodurus eques TaxID=693459 RepID=UPI002ACEC751|nr:CD48 antigen-like [Phycodurus eques]